MKFSSPVKIGIIGTGFISRAFDYFVRRHEGYLVTRILTRRKLNTIAGFENKSLFTNSLEELMDHSEIIVELSGDVVYTARNLSEILKRDIPVVTLNTDFHVTVGSYFASKGFITEAEGDQPGSMAVLKDDIAQMGFQPLVFGNIKGFLNHNPTKEEMAFWSKKQGISLSQVVSATDGTKVQMEQALIANGLGATILKKGLIGYETNDLALGAEYLANLSREKGIPIADYLLSAQPVHKKLPNGLFVVARHDEFHQPMLDYYKLGSGPNYLFHKPYYLPHLEIIKTLKRTISMGDVLINNGTAPSIGVAAIAKKFLSKGSFIECGTGSFQVRGEAIKLVDFPDFVPIGLIQNVHVKRNIEPGQMILKSDIEYTGSFAEEAWMPG